ncbi:hypothetical protein [Acidisphaera sp. S103]|uniref:hypothetical protein n=1 Tax=Acidisphaera sp. S103 TaxID=1747223 RepID=UPI00131A9226|nr:hypothetical protein [Acidisphaera sp. S103]
MATSYSYAWEKLYDAVRTLAHGSDPLAVRLRDAYTGALIRLQARDFPDPDLCERFILLKEEMSPQGRIDVALASWGEIDLRRIADLILSLYDAVARKKGDL